MSRRFFASFASFALTASWLNGSVALARNAPSAQAVVDRPRLEQKLRRASDALAGARERLREGDAVMKELLDEAREQLEQARSQLSAERSADAWLLQQMQPDRTAEKTDAGTGSMRSTDAFDSESTVERAQAPVQRLARALPGGREPLGEVGLRTLINAIRGQEFRGGKMRVLAQAAPGYLFTPAQTIEILNEVNAPADRKEALQLLVPHLTDKGNLPQLYRALANEEERTLVQHLVEP